MKKLFSLPILIVAALLYSCNDKVKESDAIKINQQGIEYMNAGKSRQALEAFLKAIRNPMLSRDSKGTIYRNISLTYNELGFPDSVIHYSTLAAKCYSKNSYDYLVNYADVDLAIGKTAGALVRLQKAIRLQPNEMSVNNALGLIYLGEYDDSFTDLDKALTYNSRAFELNNNPIIEDVLARNYYRLELYEKAESHYEHLLQNYPGRASYLTSMGMTKFRLKKKEDAENFFTKAIAQDSAYKETIRNFKDSHE